MSSPTLAALLEKPFVSRTRRNHGLEHATLHVLARRHPERGFSGHSDAGGFWIIGEATREEVNESAHEALSRMRAGEKNLAIHPGCGTNYVVSGLLAGMAGFAVFAGGNQRLRDRLERIPLAASLSILALILARPLGVQLQRSVTTSGDPEGLHIVSIKSNRRGSWMTHRVRTSG